MTSAPVESKVKREAVGSLAMTKVEPGFQPDMPVVVMEVSLVLPRLRPEPATPMRNVDVDGQLVAPEDVLDGMGVLLEVDDGDGVGVVEGEVMRVEIAAEEGVGVALDDGEVVGVGLSDDEGVGVGLAGDELERTGLELAEGELEGVGVSLADGEGVGVGLSDDKPKGAGVSLAEDELGNVGLASVALARLLDGAVATTDELLITGHVGPVAGTAHPTS